MHRRIKDTLRAGVTAIGVATGLLALASTAETPDGYIHASFGGPLDVFTSSDSASGSTDVLAIGDGTNDTRELAALLKGPVGAAAQQGAPNSPYRVAYDAGVAPNPITTTLTAPTETSVAEAPTRKDAAILPSKPVVDAQGKIDCTGALSCRTDPTTNITTVTYADGVVAIVQKINDLTVVAYQELTPALPTQLSSLLPQIPTAPPPLLAAVAPTVAPAVTPTAPVVAAVPTVVAPEPETASIDPGPPAPGANLDPISSGAKSNGTGTAAFTAPQIPSLGAIKNTIGGVVDSVKGAVGSAVGPAASSKPDTSTGSKPSSSDGSTASKQNPKSDNSKSSSAKSGSSKSGK